MAKAHIHAASSAKKFGGVPEDYLQIHLLLDSSKQVISSNAHRFLTHNSWFIANILPKIFGNTIVNSAGKQVSVSDVGEQHVLEDFNMRFIPTPQDYLEGMEFHDWMNNGASGSPNSCKKLFKKNEKPMYEIVDKIEEGSTMDYAIEEHKKKPIVRLSTIIPYSD